MNIALSWKSAGCLLLAACFLLSVPGLAGVSAETRNAPPPDCRDGAPPPPPDKASRLEHRMKALTALTAQGLLTPDQASRLQVFFREKDAQMDTAFEKLKTMPPEECHAFFQQHRPSWSDILSELQAAAGLTEEQARTVADALRPPLPPPPPRISEERIITLLKKLVDNHTITNEQSAAIAAFFKAKTEEHRAAFEKISQMNAEERHAFFRQNPPPRPDLAADLESALQLTEEQAKAVADALRPPHHRHPPAAPPSQ